MTTSEMQELVGRRVTGLEIDASKQACLVFRCAEGDLVYGTEAECCSETWFADVIGVEALLGGRVRSVTTLELPTPVDARTRQEVDEAYGYQITTERGDATVVFRNSSNGYYGGAIELCDRVPADMVLKAITQDWSA